MPVPRVLVRRVATGIDPSTVFARALGARWGLPVVMALHVPVWSPARAGRRRRPAPPRLRARRRVPDAAIVDDVVTTGATVRLAAEEVGAHRVVALSMVPFTKSPILPIPVRTMDARDQL